MARSCASWYLIRSPSVWRAISIHKPEFIRVHWPSLSWLTPSALVGSLQPARSTGSRATPCAWRSSSRCRACSQTRSPRAWSTPAWAPGRPPRRPGATPCASRGSSRCRACSRTSSPTASSMSSWAPRSPPRRGALPLPGPRASLEGPPRRWALRRSGRPRGGDVQARLQRPRRSAWACEKQAPRPATSASASTRACSTPRRSRPSCLTRTASCAAWPPSRASGRAPPWRVARTASRPSPQRRWRSSSCRASWTAAPRTSGRCG
mmetsp:Transcript_25021/g.66004  ORF Transcript_25021/g.66004 Transcript_25021/m.66004 type:complete len:264 (+) Transcript_25021:483-1274(+)